LDAILNSLIEKERAYWVNIYRNEKEGVVSDWARRADRRLTQMFGNEKQLSVLSKLDVYEDPVRILDAGCGTGSFLLSLSRFFPKSCEIYGIDIRSEALFIAGMKAGIKGQHPVKLVKASVIELPWEDGFFDIVHSKDLLEHLPEPGKAIRELMRVTKENGYFFTHVPDYRLGFEPHVKMKFFPPTGDGLEDLKRKLAADSSLKGFLDNIYFTHPQEIEDLLLKDYPSAVITRIFKRTRPFWKGIIYRFKGYKFDILARKKPNTTSSKNRGSCLETPDER